VNPGEITVIGRNGTLVDGVPQDGNGESRVTIAGVTAHLDGNFGDGNNVVNVDNVYLAGHLQLDTGSGSDVVFFGASGVVSTREYCEVRTGAGNDFFVAEDYKVFIADSLRIFLQDGGFGQSARLVGASAITSVVVTSGASEASDIVLQGVTSGGNIELEGNGRHNSFGIITSAASGNLLVSCPDGGNSIYIDTCYAAGFIQLIAVRSSGQPSPPPPGALPFVNQDNVTVARCQTSQIIVRTGGGSVHPGGSDRVQVYGNNIVGPPIQATAPGQAAAHVLYVETGDGTDLVSAIYNVANGNWFFSLGPAGGQLELVGNLVTGFASADGGVDTSALILSGNQFGGFAATRFR
jgi:hypothetical protein